VALGEEQRRGGLTGAEAAQCGRSATVAWRAQTSGVAASDSNGGTRLQTPGGDGALGHGSGGGAALDMGDAVSDSDAVGRRLYGAGTGAW
jgi:hypothetical protein